MQRSLRGSLSLAGEPRTAKKEKRHPPKAIEQQSSSDLFGLSIFRSPCPLHPIHRVILLRSSHPATVREINTQRWRETPDSQTPRVVIVAACQIHTSCQTHTFWVAFFPLLGWLPLPFVLRDICSLPWSIGRSKFFERKSAPGDDHSVYCRKQRGKGKDITNKLS